MPQPLRDTDYATEIATGRFEDYRIERIHVKRLDRPEIRFSWWKNAQLMPKPLDVTEDELLPLMQNAMREGVFTRSFLQQLSTATNEYLKAVV
jgi:hypothetical protein